MQKSLIAGLVSALILVIFALKNSSPVTIDFVIGKPVEGTPLSLVLLVTIIIGLIIGLLLSYPTIKKHKNKIAENTAEITKLSNILDEYKKEYGIHKKTTEDKPENETENKESN
jgi:uncharacterized integral membrane protein